MSHNTVLLVVDIFYRWHFGKISLLLLAMFRAVYACCFERNITRINGFVWHPSIVPFFNCKECACYTRTGTRLKSTIHTKCSCANNKKWGHCYSFILNLIHFHFWDAKMKGDIPWQIKAIVNCAKVFYFCKTSMTDQISLPCPESFYLAAKSKRVYKRIFHPEANVP